MSKLFLGCAILPDGVRERWAVRVEGGLIASVGPAPAEPGIEGAFIAPGYIDLHVHGGDGADFMDGTAQAFAASRAAHARRGTTTLLATSTVGTHGQVLRFLRACAETNTPAHLYGPYFGEQARGCHPGEGLRPPVEAEYREYLGSGVVRTATVAPELPGAEAFVRECRRRGIICTMGHSHCTFAQAEEAVGWGVSHVDHLFCAMSDRARLRQSQTYPMRGGLLEATLHFDELTTEVIADGKHLAPELLRLAYKVKGPDRLALVTDANRALGMPDGEYVFGPIEAGEKILKRDGVGVMPDGKSLASGVVGMDHLVRTMRAATGCPLHEAVRMASLTPARIAGFADRGGLEAGKRADLLVLDEGMNVLQTWVAGERVA
ncbi:MAG: amidohydrolase family protein [Gemmataceae bacterium]|nr:amidohydrolase family protein [Gemmataceae bacterium]